MGSVPGNPPNEVALLKHPKIAQFAWILLVYNLAVVAWGGFVRASFSGDGCGDHWPLCDGQLLPSFANLKQVFEFSHRITSGVVLVFVGILLYRVFSAFPKGDPTRKAASFSLIFTVSEALVGAWLVVYKLVAHNDSVYRAVSMSVHLCNTFLLLGSIALTALLAGGMKVPTVRNQGAVPWILGIGAILIGFLGVSGSISALGHSLKPVDDVLKAAAEPTAPWVVRVPA